MPSSPARRSIALIFPTGSLNPTCLICSPNSRGRPAITPPRGSPWNTPREASVSQESSCSSVTPKRSRIVCSAILLPPAHSQFFIRFIGGRNHRVKDQGTERALHPNDLHKPPFPIWADRKHFAFSRHSTKLHADKVTPSVANILLANPMFERMRIDKDFQQRSVTTFRTTKLYPISSSHVVRTNVFSKLEAAIG